jgi:hypothetical protein
MAEKLLMAEKLSWRKSCRWRESCHGGKAVDGGKVEATQQSQYTLCTPLTNETSNPMLAGTRVRNPTKRSEKHSTRTSSEEDEYSKMVRQTDGLINYHA